MQRPSFALLMLCGALALGLTAADRTNRPAVKGKGRTRAASRNVEPIRSIPQPTSTLATSFVVVLPTGNDVPGSAGTPATAETPATMDSQVATNVSAATNMPAATDALAATDTPAAADTPAATNTPAAADAQASTDKPAAAALDVSASQFAEAAKVPIGQADSATETVGLPEPLAESLIPQWLRTGEEDPVDTVTDTVLEAPIVATSDASSGATSVASSSAPADASLDTPAAASENASEDASSAAVAGSSGESAYSPSATWEPVGVAAQRVALRAATSLDRVATMFQRLADSLRGAAGELANPSTIPSSHPHAGG